VFVGSQLFLASPKKLLQLLNMDDKDASATPLNYKMAMEPFIIATDVDELFLVLDNNTGVFITKNGDPKEK
jgi:carbamate kinase